MDLIRHVFNTCRREGIWYVLNRTKTKILLIPRALLYDVNKLFYKSLTISTKQGIFKIMLSDDVISKDLYTRGEYELELAKNILPFLREIRKCSSKGDGTVLDIGANNGIISIGMLYTGEFEKGIAIEPEPRNFELLQHNVDLNGFSNRIICIPYAVSDQEDELSFELSDNNFGDHRVRSDKNIQSLIEKFSESKRSLIKVKSKNLDAIIKDLPSHFSENITLVWLDVQGYEGYVFKGGKSFFSKGVPVVSELWPYAIKRAGMGCDDFCGITGSIWSHYYIIHRKNFVRYPIENLKSLFIELELEDSFTNIILLKGGFL